MSKYDVKGSLYHSKWVTAVWHWCLRLFTRTAEPVLFLGTVYLIYSISPATPPPPWLNTIVFVTLFLSVDIAGLGLFTQVMRLKLGKASFIAQVAYILLGISAASVVWAGYVYYWNPPSENQAVKIINFSFLVIRMGMVVLYSIAVRQLDELTGETFDKDEQNIQDINVPNTEEGEQETLFKQHLPIATNGVTHSIGSNSEEGEHQGEQIRHSDKFPTTEDQPVEPMFGGEHQGEQEGEQGEQQRNNVVPFHARGEQEGEQKTSTSVEDQIRELLGANASMSDRALAQEVGCSPSTANKWKRRIQA